MVLSGCHHATIETGLPPGNPDTRKALGIGWVFGLVPPQTVETDDFQLRRTKRAVSDETKRKAEGNAEGTTQSTGNDAAPTGIVGDGTGPAGDNDRFAEYLRAVC